VGCTWFGCGSEPPPAKNAGQATPVAPRAKEDETSNSASKIDLLHGKDVKVQTPVGDSSTDDWTRAPFTITKVYRDQEFTKTKPFHSAGGHWTFFDCRLSDNSEVNFTVGVRPRGDGKGPFAWGKAVLAVADRAAGERFIAAFGKAFHSKSPRPRASAVPLEPLQMATAILGEDLKQSPGGGFDGEGGGWTATKWFPQQFGLEAEVFFNYDLQSQKGEFSEKDPEYRRDLITIFATALRDGPRPERTPDNDPNFTLAGPHILEVCRLAPDGASLCSFTPDGKHAVYQDKSAIFAIDPAKPGEPRELARFEKRIWSAEVVDNDLRLLVCEAIPQDEIGMSSDDPMRLWWVEPNGSGKQLLFGPEKDISVGGPASPDGRYVAINRWKERREKQGRERITTILDRKNRSSAAIELPNEIIDITGWRGSGQELRAVVVANRWKTDKDKPEVVYLADPKTGKLTRSNEAADFDDDALITSPDGLHRAEIKQKESLVIVDLTTGEKRTFRFHEDDLPYVDAGCVKWAGSGYLQFNPGRLAFIDIHTMKMNYPVILRNAAGNCTSHTFSPDFRWVVYHKELGDELGLYLGRVKQSGESSAK
jgi:hypothetical protein